MGKTKKIHQAKNKKHKELSERVEEFKNKVIEAGKEEKMKIVPVMDKYELWLDIKYFGKNPFGFLGKEKFRKRIIELGKSYGMAIVPKFGTYNLETEIQILQDKNPNENTKKDKKNI